MDLRNVYPLKKLDVVKRSGADAREAEYVEAWQRAGVVLKAKYRNGRSYKQTR